MFQARLYESGDARPCIITHMMSVQGTKAERPDKQAFGNCWAQQWSGFVAACELARLSGLKAARARCRSTFSTVQARREGLGTRYLGDCETSLSTHCTNHREETSQVLRGSLLLHHHPRCMKESMQDSSDSNICEILQLHWIACKVECDRKNKRNTPCHPAMPT